MSLPLTSRPGNSRNKFPAQDAPPPRSSPASGETPAQLACPHGTPGNSTRPRTAVPHRPPASPARTCDARKAGPLTGEPPCHGT